MDWRYWKRRPPTRSEEFARTLDPTPLNAHLTSLHALLIHLGAEGDALAVGEHHLRCVATFTRASIPRRPWEHPTTEVRPTTKENPS